MIDVVTLGELLIDFTQIGLSESGHIYYEQNSGGAPANVASVVSKFGAKSAFIGKVGDDIFGKFLENSLKELKIDCRNLIVDTQSNTTLAFVTLNAEGDRSFSFYRNNGADIRLKPEEIKLEIIDECRILHFGTLSMTHEPARSATVKALKHARGNGKIISFDPNYRPLLWENKENAIAAMMVGLEYADIAKLSLEEAELVTGKNGVKSCINELLMYGLSFVVVTMGVDGCAYATENLYGELPKYPAKTIDTTGAGDIFWGTVLYEFLKLDLDVKNIPDKLLYDIILIATISAGMSTEKKGAIDSIPEYQRIIEAFNCIKSQHYKQ